MPEKMADLAEIEVSTCEQIQADMWKRCPKLKAFIDQKSQWSEDHFGYVQSALGDVLEMDDSDGADRMSRLGINQYIQNYSSVSLADGFFHVISKSIHHEDEKLPDVILRPLGVVHDSCQIYYPTEYIFDMNEYYVRNLTDYLYKIHGIYYTFDLETGVNYFDICDLKQLDPTHIELSGNYLSVKSLLDKCVDDGLRFKTLSMKATPKHKDPVDIEVLSNNEFGEGFKPRYSDSLMEQYYDAGVYAKFNEDKSKFKVILEKG
jgi:hypothetical protein